MIDIIHENCQSKNKMTQLNLEIGHLVFHPNMTVQFRNLGPELSLNKQIKLESLKN